MAHTLAEKLLLLSMTTIHKGRDGGDNLEFPIKTTRELQVPNSENTAELDCHGHAFSDFGIKIWFGFACNLVFRVHSQAQFLASKPIKYDEQTYFRLCGQLSPVAAFKTFKADHLNNESILQVLPQSQYKRGL